VRTTLTLDEDVAAKLKEEMRQRGNSFKEVVNDVLRRGLNWPSQSNIPPFEVRARDLKQRPGIDFDNIEELLDRIEGPLRR
jgi:hypothetical protein